VPISSANSRIWQPNIEINVKMVCQKFRESINGYQLSQISIYHLSIYHQEFFYGEMKELFYWHLVGMKGGDVIVIMKSIFYHEFFKEMG